MIDRITSLIRKRKLQASLSERYDDYKKSFYSHPFHEWINNNRYTKATFDELFDLLPVKTRSFLVDSAPIYFLASSGKYSCALSNSKAHAIIVFPELMSLLKSTMMDHSLAIILHELGHIVADHSNKEIEIVKAQVEADRFAAELGFAKQIEEFLLDQPESVEKRVRLSFLTKYVLEEERNLA